MNWIKFIFKSICNTTLYNYGLLLNSSNFVSLQSSFYNKVPKTRSSLPRNIQFHKFTRSSNDLSGHRLFASNFWRHNFDFLSDYKTGPKRWSYIKLTMLQLIQLISRTIYWSSGKSDKLNHGCCLVSYKCFYKDLFEI